MPSVTLQDRWDFSDELSAFDAAVRAKTGKSINYVNGESPYPTLTSAVYSGVEYNHPVPLPWVGTTALPVELAAALANAKAELEKARKDFEVKYSKRN